MTLPILTALLVLGLACHLGTALVVDSEVFRPLRQWVDRKAKAAGPIQYRRVEGRITRTGRTPARHPRAYWAWGRARYLVGCHLCTGVWVALALAAFYPTPAFPGFVGWVVWALAIKAVGHATLEVMACLKRVGP